VDFRLYAQVLWRHKLLVVVGLVVAIALAELSVVSVSPSGTVKYRHAQLWSSTTRLAVGANLLGVTPPPPIDLGQVASQYAIWAESDPVRRIILGGGQIKGEIQANPLTNSGGQYQPFVDITGISTSRAASFALADRAARALQSYIQMEWEADKVPPSNRVSLKQIQRDPPVVFKSRSKTMPVLIFLVVMFAFVALAFLLENLSSRHQDDESTGHKSPGPDPLESRAEPTRRSA
jgi:hypothetical protein